MVNRRHRYKELLNIVILLKFEIAWFRIGNVTSFRGTHFLENGMHLNKKYRKPYCLLKDDMPFV